MTHHGVALDGTSGQVPNPSALLGSYDVYGNIHDHAYKPLGALSYGAGGSPYRLSHAGGAGVFYDANGNMQWQWRASQGGWVEYGWNAANKISYIHNSDTTRQMTFSYDGGGREVTRVSSRSGTTSEKKILLMGYEQSWTQAATAGAPWQLGYTRIFINTPAGVIGTYEWPGAVGGTAPGTRRYFHYDHQGSIAVVTDQWGTVMQRFSYDAFGGRRDAMFWSGRTLSDSVGSHEGAGDLGYTGHEMLHEFDLVHMGGRLYDPQLARFLSPDPFVQFPENTQNYNRYSYVLNNPLSNTDPSGYFIQLIPALLYAAGVITTTTTFIVATMITSFASVLIAGGSFGDAFKAALIAGASAVVASSVGGYFDTLGAVEGANSSLVELSRAMTHGMTSGGFSELGGGDFQSGFMAGFAGSLGGSMMGARSGEGQLFSNKGARVVGAAIVGGTASELGGGKFVNGAVTAAIIQIFNHEGVHGEAQRQNRINYRNAQSGVTQLNYDEDGNLIGGEGLLVVRTDRVPNDRRAAAYMNRIKGFQGAIRFEWTYDANGNPVVSATDFHFRSALTLPGGTNLSVGPIELGVNVPTDITQLTISSLGNNSIALQFNANLDVSFAAGAQKYGVGGEIPIFTSTGGIGSGSFVVPSAADVSSNIWQQGTCGY